MHIVRSSRDYAIVSVDCDWYRVSGYTLALLKQGRTPKQLDLEPMTPDECDDESSGREAD